MKKQEWNRKWNSTQHVPKMYHQLSKNEASSNEGEQKMEHNSFDILLCFRGPARVADAAEYLGKTGVRYCVWVVFGCGLYLEARLVLKYCYLCESTVTVAAVVEDSVYRQYTKSLLATSAEPSRACSFFPGRTRALVFLQIWAWSGLDSSVICWLLTLSRAVVNFWTI